MAATPAVNSGFCAAKSRSSSHSATGPAISALSSSSAPATRSSVVRYTKSTESHQKGNQPHPWNATTGNTRRAANRPWVRSELRPSRSSRSCRRSTPWRRSRASAEEEAGGHQREQPGGRRQRHEAMVTQDGAGPGGGARDGGAQGGRQAQEALLLVGQGHAEVRVRQVRVEREGDAEVILRLRALAPAEPLQPLADARQRERLQAEDVALGAQAADLAQRGQAGLGVAPPVVFGVGHPEGFEGVAGRRPRSADVDHAARAGPIGWARLGQDGCRFRSEHQGGQERESRPSHAPPARDRATYPIRSSYSSDIEDLFLFRRTPALGLFLEYLEQGDEVTRPREVRAARFPRAPASPAIRTLACAPSDSSRPTKSRRRSLKSRSAKSRSATGGSGAGAARAGRAAWAAAPAQPLPLPASRPPA